MANYLKGTDQGELAGKGFFFFYIKGRHEEKSVAFLLTITICLVLFGLLVWVFYFSIAVKGYHDQGNLQKKTFDMGFACSFIVAESMLSGRTGMALEQ